MTTWLYYGWLTASAVFIVLTWLPLSRNTAWWVRVWEFPRLQAAIWGLLLVVTGVTLPVPSPLLNTAVLLALSAAIVWHLWWILPYTRWYKREVPDHGDTTAKASISLLTANVLTPNRKAPELISLIKRWKPDLVLTLESDHWWEEQLIGLQSDYPHTVFHPLDNLYGIHLYSRLPLIDPEVQFLVEPNVPSIHTLIDLGQGQQIRAHFLHPAPPSPTENLESIERDAELLVVAKSVCDYPHPVLIAGDLNDVAWSATSRLFRKISTLLDPRVGRGLLNTFHAGIPFIRFPLDHIFVSSHFLVRRLERLPSFGSDHFPIFAELAVVAPELGGTPEVQADQQDHVDARTTIESTDARPDDVHEPKLG